VIGGGSRSRTWIAIIAATLGIPLHRVAAGEHVGGFGAARLARMASTGEAPETVCIPPARVETIMPDPALATAYQSRIVQYRGSFDRSADRSEPIVNRTE
jgi:xylulokinase